ncbi:LamG domain-containing protein [Saccharicrinis aurantiacus]|uniref:LamG domain-containing protein n=1 Tax=Saccharicrinis aurantiacus TaxID=1849719 RepID=UPI00094FE89D|nr:LamG domain-containing protein [Saccharicrinis aurantiacus]
MISASVKKISLVLGLFLTCCMASIYAQQNSSALIFSDDLYHMAKHVDGLQPIADDAVRPSVVAFIPNKEALQINNSRKDAISVSLWFCPQNIKAHPGTLFGENENFYFRYLSNNQLQFNLYLRHDINTDALVNEGQWQHAGFTITKDGELSIYYNGDLVLQDTLRVDWNQKKSSFIVGNDKYNMGAEGKLDKLNVWDTVLTPEEMKAIYTRQLIDPVLDYKLQAYLPLKENAIDVSNNACKTDKIQNILFEEDKERGSVAHFTSDSSLIKFSGVTLGKQQTVALWVKPKNDRYVAALVGNNDFSLRYSYTKGQLWYSVPLLYLLESERFKVKKDNWMHVAVTLSYNHKISFYLNGVLLSEHSIADQTGGANFIELGRSLWNAGDSYKGAMSEVLIWDRLLSANEIKDVYNGKLKLAQKQKSYLAYYFALVLVCMLLLALLIIKKRRNKKTIGNQNIKRELLLPKQNAIYFYDKFRAFDADGNNVSAEFTPTLIRLFTLFILYPKVYNRNVTSAEISSILWDADTASQQKNNRNTNVHRLRAIFKKMGGIQLLFQDKSWFIETSEATYIDVNQFEHHLSNTTDKIALQSLRLDSNLHNDGFDAIISLLNDQHLKLLAELCEGASEGKNYVRMAHLSLLWLSVDSLSDTALRYRIRALLHLQQKQNALNAYQQFCKNYQQMLHEAFEIRFDELIK